MPRRKAVFDVLFCILFASALGFIVARAALAAPDVMVKIDQVVVLPSSSAVKLGAISNISGDPRHCMAVANVPIVPSNSNITKALILQSIKSCGLKDFTISVIFPGDMKVAAEDPYLSAIRSQIAWPWKLEAKSCDKIDGEILDVSRVKVGIKNVSVKVRTKDGSVRYKRFQLRWIAPMFTAARQLEFGKILEPDDVSFMTSPCRDERIPGSADDLYGRRLKRPLEAGEPICGCDVEPVFLVKRGEKVRFYSRAGTVTIETIAKALDSGALNDVIRVVNPDSRKVITGQVVGEGVVMAKEENS